MAEGSCGAGSAGGGVEKENGSNCLLKMDSTESRWVARDSESSDDENQDMMPLRFSFKSEEEEDDEEEGDYSEPRLTRTGPRVDSFDVEAFDISGAHRNDYAVRVFSLFPLISKFGSTISSLPI